jgi:ribosomal protein L11 methyltransferase
VRDDQADVVLAELLELAPGGLEEKRLDGGVVEYAIYGAPGELPSVGSLHAVVGDGLVEVITHEVAEGWQTRWREFHRPVTVGGTVTVRPPWITPAASGIDVAIDPGQAFGTGAHPTTRLCLELLLELEPSGPLLDLGCGSGVLAIAASIMGYAPVVALDNDPAAIQAARENARLNDVEIEVRRHDLRMDRVLVAQTTVANLLAPLLVNWAERLRDATEVPRHLVAGGLVPAEAAAITEAFAVHGLEKVDQRSSTDWTALLLTSDG